MTEAAQGLDSDGVNGAHKGQQLVEAWSTGH